MNKKFETLKAGLGNGLKVTPVKLIKVAQEIKGVIKHTNGDTFIEAGSFNKAYCIEDVTPHLFPLDHLTKPMRIEGYNNGEEFVPVKEMAKDFLFDTEWFTDLEEGNLSIQGFIYHNKEGVERKVIVLINGEISDECPLIHYRQMIEWRFNVFNLPPDQFIDAAESKVYEPQK